jgi:hypothetical protein
MKKDRTYIIYSHRFDDSLHVMLQFPCEICEIDVKFFDEKEIQVPGEEIYFQIDIGFKSPGGSATGARMVLRMDSHYNYVVHPGVVISQINGIGYRHEQAFLNETDLSYVKDAILCFLDKVRSDL